MVYKILNNFCNTETKISVKPIITTYFIWFILTYIFWSFNIMTEQILHYMLDITIKISIIFIIVFVTILLSEVKRKIKTKECLSRMRNFLISITVTIISIFSATSFYSHDFSIKITIFILIFSLGMVWIIFLVDRSVKRA